ncbi:MAG: DUF3047 domain-containing protein [Bacteroidetes bacterium]|nr:DUF3047 domain-containing protein [Rhodothermia bacterium]MCS7154706.1 DUF3047 domain-containing protein [Bacteroidota bacterium]MCX7907137.1 DUF3047 domain-containing protein [Bacteroidota bacterium]MDW8137499.1 DUF3047 domain-containing protein [Bacteroidota bacterium]MDW8285547.1 DUF3047 domain-containing protein [Bacteroidota bacterium]
MPRLGDCLPPLRRPLPGSAVLIEDFELDPPGHWPQAWGALEDRRLRPITAQDTAAGRYPFRIRRECDNQFVRVRTEGIWTYVLYPNGERRIWNLHTHPVLYWNWRVRRLPRGAREDQRAIDDSAAGLMITFSVNALGVPRTIRYVWSSTLPVGTVLSKGVWGNLKIVVVASGPEGLNRWMSLVRDVRQDYRRLFGGEPPAIPLAIGLWSDSDSTQDQSEADFDNLIALPSAELAMRLLP